MRRLFPSLLVVGLVVVASFAFTVAPTSTGPDLQTVPYMAEDTAGDANALNGQGFQDIGSTSTAPAQVAEGDVLAARITSLHQPATAPDGTSVNRLTGLEFRTALAAEPTAEGPGLLHRFNGTVGGCLFFVEAYTGAGPLPAHLSTSVRLNGTGCGLGDDLTYETVSGTWLTGTWDDSGGELVVTMDLDGADQRLADLLTRGATYLLDGLAVRGNGAVVVAPVIDEMLGQNGYTIIGDDIPPPEEPDGGGGSDGGHTGGGGNDVPRDTRPVCGRYDGGSIGTTPTQGNDRTGANADTLSFGLHAPATGAAPLPTTSFQKASDLYWRALTEDCGETVLGRSSVDVQFRDDKYDPNSAGQVCKELASDSFIVLGGGGTDQVQRCGQLANVSLFPYFSVGVTEAGLRDNPWYFGSTMSFREQGGLLAEYVAANPDQLEPLGPDARIGTIVTDTVNFDDALQGWHQGMADNGLEDVQTVRHTKNDASWISQVVRDFQQQGVEVVYFLSAPTMLLDFANHADASYGYNPLYIGVASDTSLDAVLQSGCREPGRRLDGGVWLSGTPGLDAAPTAFFEAADMFDTPADDIALRMWAFAEQQRELLAGYREVHGHDLTREDLRAFVEGGGTTIDGTFPTASWSAPDHFPSGGMHVVQANCEREQHVTLHVDASGF